MSDAELFLPLVSSLSLISELLLFRSQLFWRLLCVASLCKKLFHALILGCLSYSCIWEPLFVHLFILCMYVYTWGCMCALVYGAVVGYISQRTSCRNQFSPFTYGSQYQIQIVRLGDRQTSLTISSPRTCLADILPTFWLSPCFPPL